MSKVIKNSNKTKSKKKLETMGNSSASKDKPLMGEVGLASITVDAKEKTSGEKLMSALKGKEGS